MLGRWVKARRRNDDRIPKVRTLLARRGVGDVRIGLRVARDEEAVGPCAALDARPVRVVDPVDECANGGPNRQRSPQSIEGLTLDAHRYRRRGGDRGRREDPANEGANQDEAHERPPAPGRSDTSGVMIARRGSRYFTFPRAEATGALPKRGFKES